MNLFIRLISARVDGKYGFSHEPPSVFFLVAAMSLNVGPTTPFAMIRNLRNNRTPHRTFASPDRLAH